MTTQHYTIAEIDMAALRHNLGQVRERVGSNRHILAVVKANAYGHGSIHVSSDLIDMGVSMLGVAYLEEGIELREAGVKIPILIMAGIMEKEAGEALRYNLTPALFERSTAKAIEEAARSDGKTAGVHIKVDTGMGRIGVRFEEAVSFVEEISGMKGIRIEGIMTHFSDADLGDRGRAKEQVERFNRIIDGLKSKGLNIPLKHMANSAAIIGYEQALLDMVRPGIMLYGYFPSERVERIIDLIPVLTLKSKVTYLKKVPPGTGISYGSTFVTKRESLIATVPAGYADGYSRYLSNCGKVLIGGKKAPVVGTVCMDMIMVDVTENPAVKLGDEVILIGRQGMEKITAQDIATLTGTIPYEVLCDIGRRVKRVYKNVSLVRDIRPEGSGLY